MSDQGTEFPPPPDFCLTVPLYKSFIYDKNKSDPFWALEYFKGTLDCYCEGCGRHSVFSSDVKNYHAHPVNNNYVFLIKLTCSRDENHQLIFIFRSHQGLLAKIGQYPSIADLAIPDLQKYRVVLGEERYRELTRGVGLASHGVGIGAFAYLRRVFEALIEKARLKAASEGGWDQDTFERVHMDEKIKTLERHLPPFLVENRALYGILSKGIHVLTEEECLTSFPVVKLGIELILDDELERHRRDLKIAAARKNISRLSGELKES